LQRIRDMISRAKNSQYAPAQAGRRRSTNLVGRCAPLPTTLSDLDLGLLLVEEILARAETKRLMKIYNLPTFSSMLEFLTMPVLNTGRLLKVSYVSIYPHPLCPSKLNAPPFLTGQHPRYPLRSAPSARRLEPSKDPFLL
jgi:hypothetical protein